MTDDSKPPEVQVIEAEAVETRLQTRWTHLAENRGMIVRRALLSAAVGGAVPIPVLDDLIAVRVRAGLYMKLAERRHVGLSAAAAEVLAQAKESSRLGNATMTAATLLAVKLAWRKMFAVVAVGRGADDAASNFQNGLLFDHYCARLHVGPAIDRARAAALRRAIHETVAQTHREALVAIFRDGTRTLGRSLLQAPRWLVEKVGGLAQRWVHTKGDVAATFEAGQLADDAVERKWLDKASDSVDSQIASLGQGYLNVLVPRFEATWALAAAKLEAPPVTT